jgi:hypothetical protein
MCGLIRTTDCLILAGHFAPRRRACGEQQKRPGKSVPQAFQHSGSRHRPVPSIAHHRHKVQAPPLSVNHAVPGGDRDARSVRGGHRREGVDGGIESGEVLAVGAGYWREGSLALEPTGAGIFECRLPQQFDAIVHFDVTSALEPLDITSVWEEGDAPETYPFNV